MKLTAMALGVALASTASALAGDHVAVLAELDRAQAAWTTKAPKNYSYTLVESHAFGWGTYDVVVRGTNCTSKWKSGQRNSRWQKEPCDANQIGKILSDLRANLAIEPKSLEVKFDPVYGYVQLLRIEPGGEFEDQYWSVQVTSFKKE
jgi:hypothetical protein